MRVKIRNAVVDYVKSQVEDAFNHVENISLKLNKPSGSNENRIRYYLCGQEKNLMFTVDFEDLINTGTKLKIYVEIQNDLMKKREKLKGIEFTEEEKERFKNYFYTTKENYALFATQTFELKTDEISNLSLYISDKINNDPIGSIYRKLENALVESK